MRKGHHFSVREKEDNETEGTWKRTADELELLHKTESAEKARHNATDFSNCTTGRKIHNRERGFEQRENNSNRKRLGLRVHNNREPLTLIQKNEGGY